MVKKQDFTYSVEYKDSLRAGLIVTIEKIGEIPPAAMGAGVVAKIIINNVRLVNNDEVDSDTEIAMLDVLGEPVSDFTYSDMSSVMSIIETECYAFKEAIRVDYEKRLYDHVMTFGTDSEKRDALNGVLDYDPSIDLQ